MFFGFGGFLVLGVNAVNIALPAVMVYYLCRQGISSGSPKVAATWGAIGGAGSIVITTVMVAFSLMLSGEAFLLAAKATFLAHIPVMIVEGFVTAAAVLLIRKVKPEFLNIKEDSEYA